MPAQADPDSPAAVRARHFQQALIQRKVLVTLQASCKCCSLSAVIPMTLFVDTDLAATRHLDYLNDGTVRTVDTGVVPLVRIPLPS